MKAHLMYHDRDLDLDQKLPVNSEAVMQDLGLDTLFDAMANCDDFFFNIAKQVVLRAPQESIETILYRQAILNDALRNHSVVQNIYDQAVEGIENRKKQWIGIIGRHPSSILWGGVELMQMSLGVLDNLRRLATEHGDKFRSDGFKAFFAMIRAELTEEYLAQIRTHLHELKFERGVLVSAQLGDGNRGTNYTLRKTSDDAASWWMDWIAPHTRSDYSFRIADRDEAGARALSEIKERGINFVANSAAQSSDHVLSFFTMLRTELAFYLGCVNLHRKLGQKNVPISFPVPAAAGNRRHTCVGLRDASLALSIAGDVVGNELNADSKNVVIITGANQGGKSTFLRSIGQAQMMMQSGMFVAAESFSADICAGLFTHYKREEDPTMKSGKLDEELSRMSEIVDELSANALLLFNESYAATNEREGSEIARQIIRALGETSVKVFYVTHLYDFAHRLWEDKIDNAIFLRAGREADGRRTFKLSPGEPLQTSFGADLYQEIFENAAHS